MKRYSSSYLNKRDEEIDYTEWRDILRALRALGLRPGQERVIVELCAGKGYLLEWLEERLPGNRFIGVDLLGCRYSDRVECRDLNREYPPPAHFYISQHCLEHLDQERAREILWLSTTVAIAGVHIVPGHLTSDPTHVVNHYHYEELVRMAGESGAPHYLVLPDTLSYIYPWSTDYVVIVSREPINPRRIRPLWLHAWLRISEKLLEGMKKP